MTAADGGAGLASPAEPPGPSPGDDQQSLGLTTLEIFFDLVFAFTLTQLTSVLASHVSWLAVGQVLLLLVGMAGFLVVGLAIPNGFGSYGLVLGLGYLTVVLVHTVLYYRVNANILRVAPVNIATAVLMTVAGLVHGPAGTASRCCWAWWPSPRACCGR